MLGREDKGEAPFRIALNGAAHGEDKTEDFFAKMFGR